MDGPEPRIPNSLLEIALSALPKELTTEEVSRQIIAAYRNCVDLVGETNAAKIWRSIPSSKPGPKSGDKRASTRSTTPIMLQRFHSFVARPENCSLRRGTAIRQVAAELEQDSSLEFAGSKPTAEAIMKRLQRALKEEDARRKHEQVELEAKLKQLAGPPNSLMPYTNLQQLTDPLNSRLPYTKL